LKIKSGEWDKTKGACASTSAGSQTASVIEAVVPQTEEATSTPAQEETASSTPEIVVETPEVVSDTI
jgi:hypothetical protein